MSDDLEDRTKYPDPRPSPKERFNATVDVLLATMVSGVYRRKLIDCEPEIDDSVLAKKAILGCYAGAVAAILASRGFDSNIPFLAYMTGQLYGLADMITHHDD
ncbi:MAG: hypothetical protein ACE5DM_04570 [Candidatus Nanoarchaeia archaeon]